MRELKEQLDAARPATPVACPSCESCRDQMIDMQAEINILRNKVSEREELIRMLQLISSTAAHVSCRRALS